MWHSLLNVSAFRQQKNLKVANPSSRRQSADGLKKVAEHDDLTCTFLRFCLHHGWCSCPWNQNQRSWWRFGKGRVEIQTDETARKNDAGIQITVRWFSSQQSTVNTSCSYSTNRSGTCNGCYEFKVNFSLNQAKGPHQDDVDNQDKPIAILAIVDYNDEEKFPLMELQCSDKLNVWKSEEEIQIDASCCRQPKTKDDSLRARFSQCLWLARYGCTSAISAPTIWRFSNLVQTCFSSKLIAMSISLSKTVRQLELTKMF